MENKTVRAIRTRKLLFNQMKKGNVQDVEKNTNKNEDMDIEKYLYESVYSKKVSTR